MASSSSSSTAAPTASSISGSNVHVCAAFHVQNKALPGFYEAASTLLAKARSDEGCKKFELQGELSWARANSNEAQTLFMVFQEWESAKDLEAHVASLHAMSFDAELKNKGMLGCQPSLSLFGPALGVEELKKMAEEERAVGGQDTTPVPVLPPRPDSASSRKSGAAGSTASSRVGRGGGYTGVSRASSNSRLRII
eukprot:TRINITY_DN6727_c0_g1_i2.p1 TRINITY_DN6727_c0_g1~~TRINITY_DN6727_c0_g1_i2.p1  ORF type:complete len:196 (-),score=45.64 TRINITY_DN6727_c0_g1_i2:230-817(-)